MKTVLEVSLQEARQAQAAINDSPLRSELNQVSSNVWELPSYDMFDDEECDNDEELKDEIRDLFSQWRISEEEYEFNEEEF